MRVQFTVNNAQWQELVDKAKKEGYPDVSSYCKAILLQDKSYGQLWQTVIAKISKMESGETFALRDLVDVPPATLGVKLYQNQKDLQIERIEKDNLNSNVFRKL